MRTRWFLGVPVAFALACGPSPADLPSDSAAAAPVQIDAWVDDQAGSTDLIVRTIVSDDTEAPEVRVEVPDALDLGAPRAGTERGPGTRVTTRRYRLDGAPGRYVLDRLCVDAPDPICASPVYLDLGVPGEPDVMQDIVEPEAVRAPIPWGLVIGSGVAAGTIALLLLALVSRPRKALPPAPSAPPVPPWDAALARWEAVRRDGELDDLAKAHALSEITRVYLDAALAFPAAKWSTTEILAHLQALVALPEGNVPRIRRLLRATDRVKYAGDNPGAYFFEELDADLRAVIDSTRPHHWTPETTPADPPEDPPPPEATP